MMVLTAKGKPVEGTFVSRYLGGIFKVYLAFLCFVTICYGWLNWHLHSDWAIGEWLINYQAGFVRRGLAGEVAFLIGRALHVSPMTVVVILQLLLYGIIFYSVWRLLQGTQWSFWVMLLVFSPATLAFQVLDPPAGFRKEDIYLAGLAMLVLLLSRARVSTVLLVLYVSVVCMGCVLCHEPLLCYMPYYLAAVVIGLQSIRKGLWVSALPFLLSAGAALWAVRRPGTFAMAQKICHSVGETLTLPAVGVCGGSIYYLGNSKEFAHQELIRYVNAFHYYRIYSICGLLALLPVALGFFVLWRSPTSRFDLKVLGAAVGAAGAASLVLFLYATDWGRWIYIHIFSMFLILLFIDRRRRTSRPVSEVVRLPRVSTRRALLGAGFLVVYAVCWDLPHIGIYSGRFGYFGLAHYVAQYRTLHTG